MAWTLSVAIAALLGGVPAAGDDLAPFPMPSLAPLEGAADFSFLLDRPAGGRGFVAARDGHFFAGDKRIRFWGVNVCFAACFPPKEVAPRVAARLAALGVNCVRFHHMDTGRFPGGIFRDARLEELSPEALERLDTYIAELAKRGIYADLNLHVSRWWSKAHGWPHAGELESFDKMLDIFHPDLIAAQKRYARDLLDHVNPHTGRRYAEEPAVALVEVTNEDSLFEWGSMWQLARLPDPYAGMLREKWNGWLKARHETEAALRKAWGAGEEPLGAEEIRDPGFDGLRKGFEGRPVWDLETHEGARARYAGGGERDGKPVLRIEVEAVTATSWHVQFKQARLEVKKGRPYTVRFLARADREKSIAVNCGQDKSPWGNLGLAETARIGTEWREHRLGFVASAAETDARLSFTLGGDRTAVEIAGVSFRPGGRLGLLDGESLEKGTIALFPEAGAVTEARADDRLRFLRDVERDFFAGMRKFLREELGVRQPITGTIAFGALGTQVQAETMDFVDQHAYWRHPDFPRRPWDSRDWVIGNRAMTADRDGGTLPGLALTRVWGKPYTVTEYNHPAPIDSQAETVPVIASFAAFHDWDGIFLFSYNHGGDYDRDSIHGFFDIDGNPAKTALLGAGALVFGGHTVGRGWVSPTHISDGEAVAMARRDPTNVAGSFRDRGITIDRLLAEGWAIEFTEARQGTPTDATPRADWIRWDHTPGRERYTVDCPATKVACGRTAGPLLFDGLRLDVASPAAASILLVARDREPVDRSRSLLLVAAGRVENTGMEWNADRSSVGDRWGTAPTRIEVVRGTVHLRGAPVKSAAALDGSGRKAGEIAASRDGDATVFPIGGGPPTLWYAIER